MCGACLNLSPQYTQVALSGKKLFIHSPLSQNKQDSHYTSPGDPSRPCIKPCASLRFHHLMQQPYNNSRYHHQKKKITKPFALFHLSSTKYNNESITKQNAVHHDLYNIQCSNKNLVQNGQKQCKSQYL